MSNDAELPNTWDMVKSFTKDLAKYISEGAPNVSAKDYAQRVGACEACEHFNKEKARCKL